MNFKKFAYNSVTRNFKSYLGYYFSSTISIMMFFIFAMSMFHPSVASVGIQFHSSLGMALTFTETIIALFSLLFIVYSLGTFVKSRYTEFGTLFILGMSPKQFKKFVLLENLIIGFASIVSGILIGFIFAKPFLKLISDLFQTKSDTLYFPSTAIILTFIVFTLLFIITSPVTIILIKNKNVIELLKGTKKPKSEPKTSIFLAITSVVLLSGSYMVVLFQLENMEYLMFIALMLGTYLFFSQFFVLILKMIKRKRSFYQNKINVLWISNLIYKIKDNCRLLFLISILLSGTLVSISVLSSLGEKQLEASKSGFPFNIFYMSTENNKISDSQMKLIENTLDKNKYNFKKYEYKFLNTNDRQYVINNSEFNKIGAVLGYKKIRLNSDEAALIPTKSSPNSIKSLNTINEFNIQDVNLHVKFIVEGPLLAEGFYNNMLVVSDDMYKILETNKSTISWTGYGYNYNGWEDSLEMIDNLNNERKTNADNAFGEMGKFDYEYFATLTDVYQVELTSTKTMLFVGTFIGIIFFIGSCSFLYFRFYTDLIFDKEKYKNLSKIGLSYTEMKKILNIEMSSIFFIPFIIATLNAVFAILILKSMNGSLIGLKGLLVPIIFFVIYFIYFVILKSIYIKSISNEILSYKK
ncbi:FtsX-like permease family protein [Clostridium ihumii]|uniref:FtsX-like permease family protein n=1 Tax=Clostridium ihumii TaxID=1470356 RepID=UPI00058C1BD8|nr:ABC transporter permease [Clostridium ihumii]